MKHKLTLPIIILSLIATLWLTATVVAAPFIPVQWQERVKSGALENQRKHIDWSRDLDGDFLDDAFLNLSPGDKTKVIVQLSDCRSPDDLKNHFSPFGDVIYTGTIVGYVVIENVPQEMLPDLAKDPLVAAVEKPREIRLFHDTSTRTIRQRASNTFSPNTFADAFPGINGSGVNIAVVDTGVDDAVHAAFAGKFVSGYNACTDTAGNPDDDLPNPSITTGANGICNTTATGDDGQDVPVGQTPPNLACVGPGPNGVLDSVPAGDDFIGSIPYTGCSSTSVIATGADGVCNTLAAGDDYQVAPFNGPPPNIPCISPGTNGSIESTPGGDDSPPQVVHHGTHVAGSALGLGVGPGCRNAGDGSVPNNCAGVAPGAGLVDVKVFQNSCVTDEDLLGQALDWIWQDGNTDVVNMSLGTNTQDDGTDTVSNVINALVANDITAVVAAGNSIGNCLGAVQASSLAITVANDNDIGTINRADDQFAFSSTFGPRVDFNPANPDVGMLKPDVAAPGTDIFSVQGETGNTADLYHSLSGTSMASPHVAGAAALLIDMRSDVPPGAIKDLFKRTAFQTPQHVGAGASFPAVNAIYNVNWGWGLIDLFAAGNQLSTGITDMSFTDCVGPHPDYPAARRCLLSGGKPSYANNVDIQLATDPPVQEAPNTITVTVENPGGSAAQNVVVCVGVKDFAVGVQEFYDVGCQEIANIGPGGNAAVSIPWTPTASSHQCIQASIDYGLDTDFTNNLTQRNVNPVPASSPAVANFRVENPLNEKADIILELRLDPEAKKILEV
ncbi:MAG: S8 family serine peptidase, partial [Planctomycetota bacterium]